MVSSIVGKTKIENVTKISVNKSIFRFVICEYNKFGFPYPFGCQNLDKIVNFVFCPVGCMGTGNSWRRFLWCNIINDIAFRSCHFYLLSKGTVLYNQLKLNLTVKIWPLNDRSWPKMTLLNIKVHIDVVKDGRTRHEIDTNEGMNFKKSLISNLEEIFGKNWKLAWISPFISSELYGDGTHYIPNPS